MLSSIRARALVLFLVFAALVNYLVFRDYRFDDSFITYRYASNLAAGEGFVFSPGERVLGTSTPLWALLLGLLGALGLDIAASGAALFCLCLSACAWFGARILKEHGAPNAGALFALAVAWGTGGVFIHFGMETSLYLALIFCAFWIAARDRPWTTGLLLGCIALTRYDGVIVVGVVLLYRWARSRRPPWREAVVPGVMLALWLLFAQLYFGSPLPNTLAAKAEDSTFLDYWRGSLNHQFLLLVSPLRRYWDTTGISLTIRSASAVLLLLPAVIGARRLPHRLWLLPASAVLLWFGYALIGPPVSQRWYLTPAVFGLLAFGLAGWALVLPFGRLGRLAPAGVLALIVLSVVFMPASARAEYDRMTTGAGYTQRVLAYGEIADFILDHDLERTRVMTIEPGYLTYLTGQPAIDAAGLVTPGIRFHGPPELRTGWLSLVEDRQPDMMVMRSVSSRMPPVIRRDYIPVYRVRIMQLLLRRTLIDQHIDRLHRTWLRTDFYQPDGEQPSLQHPFAVDFQKVGLAGWRSAGRGSNFVGYPRKHLKFRGQRILDPYLHTAAFSSEQGAAIWGPRFPIDFDELVLHFGGTDPERTKVQLFVGGLKVLEVAGRGPARLPEVNQVELPVYGWRGKIGALRFLDLDGAKNYLVADHLRSRRYENFTPFDDFDSGEYGGHWLRGFGAAPLATLEIARRYGPSFILGSHAAASLGLEGPQRLVSRPFAIENDWLSFLIYDFGGPENRVDLQIDGESVLGFECGGTESLVSVKWELSPWRGREGTLVVSDGTDAADQWIGIDSIAFHDGAEE